MKTKLSPFSLIILSAFATSSVYAQVDAGALQQGLEKQLPLPSPLILPELGHQTVQPKSQLKEAEVRFTVKQFMLEGVKILPEADIQQVLQDWLGKPVSFEDLRGACDAIQNLYRQRGFTAQATLPPQKIIDGVVKIVISEARLGGVLIDMPQGQTRFGQERAAEYITYANPIGQPLNMLELERAVIVLNEIPGVTVASQLEQGQQDGEVNVHLQLTEPNMVFGRVEANTYGSKTTGVNQGIFSVALNNPAGYGDSVTINGIGSEGSQYVQGAYSLPGSPNGLRLGVSSTFLHYKNIGSYAANGGTGDAQIYNGATSIGDVSYRTADGRYLGKTLVQGFLLASHSQYFEYARNGMTSTISALQNNPVYIRTLVSKDPTVTFNGTVDDVTNYTHTLLVAAIAANSNLAASTTPIVNFNHSVSQVTPLFSLNVQTLASINNTNAPDLSAYIGQINLLGAVKTFSNQTFRTGLMTASSLTGGLVSFSVYDPAASIMFLIPPKTDGSGQINLTNPGSQDILRINGISNFMLMPNLMGENSWSRGYQQKNALNYVETAASADASVVVKKEFTEINGLVGEVAVGGLESANDCDKDDQKDAECRLKAK